jgi:UDP-GlcNAc:undecaprenyl-phosphate GlcNAc-1-phosphate transferase
MDGNWFYLLIPMAAALAASLVLTPLVRRLAWRLRVLAYPDAERRFHPGPVPLLGGVAVYFALVAGLIAALLLDRFRQPDLVRLCWTLIPAAALACLFGAIDDCCNLRSRAKLALQFLAASLITAAGFSVNFIIVFGYRIELGWWGVPLTIGWLLGCINALNLIDGLDGLASVVGLSTTSMLGIIAMRMENEHVAAVALTLTAALAGFLVFNRPPASVFLGDSGSTLIGLVIGVLGIQGALKSPVTLSITAPVVLMTLPMFDVIMAVVRRKLTGRPLALGDREHIHHCLLERGLGPWQVLGILGALCLTTGAAATAATFFRMDALAWIIAATLIVLMIRLRVFGHREFGLIRQLLRRQAGNLVHSLFQRKPSPVYRIDSQHSAGAETAEERPETMSARSEDRTVVSPPTRSTGYPDQRKAA